MNAASPVQTDDQKGAGSLSDSEADLGPNFESLAPQKSVEHVLKYAWRHHRFQIIIMGGVMTVLFIGVLIWNELYMPVHFLNSSSTVHSASPSSWIDWLIRVQSFLGVGTLLVALSVWWGEIREDWQNDLPKRLSVFFFYGSHPVIVCRYVWLAGADELRTWGQQVAKQAAGNQILDFGPDVEARKPVLIAGPNGTVWVHYSVCFKLTDLNPYLKMHSGKCIYQNLAAEDKRSRAISFEKAESLPEVADWRTTGG